METAHGMPSEGMECLATMEDITIENYCEYQTAPSGKWYPALFAAEVVQQLVDTQFHSYLKKVQQPDCKAELRRLVTKGPPIWVEDKHAMPLQDGETHISNLWFAKEDDTKSAKLDGAVEGEEREQLWNELKQLLDAMEEDTDEVR